MGYLVLDPLPNTGQKTNESMAVLFGGIAWLFVGAAGMLLGNKKIIKDIHIFSNVDNDTVIRILNIIFG